MSELQKLRDAVQEWAVTTSEHGLLANSSIDQLESFNARTPANLFENEERPLVVGFFGGTGVGKSTLLNRLAGEEVARTGVERPTSREVTMYLHSTVHVDHLPAEYPTGQIKTAFHNNDENRNILWIDMPDFDSAESANRLLVNDWLPHIDLLIYVVSPERYRDDNGWRLLLQHGARHAWVFVINHWDKGAPEQRDDFTSLLNSAGLDKPYLFCTDSSPEPGIDEFDSLRDLIQSMASAKTIAVLQQRGTLSRINDIQSIVDSSVTAMGHDDTYSAVLAEWDAFWQVESAQVQQDLGWKYPLLAKRYEAKESGWFDAILKRLSGKSASDESADTLPATLIESQTLFDREHALSLTDDIQEVVQLAAKHGLPARAVRNAVAPISDQIESRINQAVEQARDAALSSPGTPLQRVAARCFSVLTSLLPLLALTWAGYRIVYSFYLGGSNPAQYLGSNFAINALLLLGLSWLLPFVLTRKLTPSLPRAAMRGMHQGATDALNQLQQDVHAAFEKLRSIKNARVAAAEELFADVPTLDSVQLADELNRALIEREHIS